MIDLSNATHGEAVDALTRTSAFPRTTFIVQSFISPASIQVCVDAALLLHGSLFVCVRAFIIGSISVGARIGHFKASSSGKRQLVVNTSGLYFKDLKRKFCFEL